MPKGPRRLSPGLDASTSRLNAGSTRGLDASTPKLDASMPSEGVTMLCCVKDEASTPRRASMSLDAPRRDSTGPLGLFWGGFDATRRSYAWVGGVPSTPLAPWSLRELCSRHSILYTCSTPSFERPVRSCAQTIHMPPVGRLGHASVLTCGGQNLWSVRGGKNCGAFRG